MFAELILHIFRFVVDSDVETEFLCQPLTLSLTAGDADARATTAIVLGFGYATTDDLSSAVPERNGQVVIPVRSDTELVTDLVARWTGPVFLRAEEV
jgi:hypothetical protein